MKHVDIEYLIYRHRDMWRWISHQIMKSRRCLDIDDLKEQYIKDFESREFYFTLSNSGFCYLCYLSGLLADMADMEGSRFHACVFCYKCIQKFEWKCSNSIARCLNDLYRDALYETESYEYQAYVAYEISILNIDMEKAKQMFGIDKSE